MSNLFLQFDVRGQEIRRSDKHKLFSGSRNFVKAHFIFDNCWSGVTKYAQYTASGTTYTVEIVNGESIVPWEVLHAPNTFDVSVFGGDLITANIVKVDVEESGLRDGELPTEPTPGYFQSIVEEVKESESTAKYYKEAAQVAAQQTDADREAVAADKQTVLEGLNGFTDSTLPGAIQAVTEQAEEEIVRIESTGTSQIGLVTEQANRAESEADRAESEADKSTSQASKSESYAIGGTGTRPGEDEDNSKHYSEVAQSASESVATSAGAALSAKQAAETAQGKAEDAQGITETARDEAKEYAESIYLWQKAPTLATMDFAIMLYPPALASI